MIARRRYPPLVHVRRVEMSDGQAIGAIYNLEVETSFVTFDIEQWSAADVEAWIARHQGAYPAVVAAVTTEGAAADTVVGFGSLSRFRSRPGYATTVEDSLYVERSSRRLGAGRAILEELLALAADHGFHSVIARIVGHNEASIALHRSCGFELVGVEREVGRKHGRWLDVVELQRVL
jgi:L-amino acid N-acyltransferase YncA